MAEPEDNWRGWLDRHGPALLLLARQYVRSASDAEDVVQEAFVRFWRTRQSVRNPAAYLYLCVKRCALDWQRGRRRETQRQHAVARPDHEPMFENQAVLDERQRQAQTAIGNLPTEQAEVLVLKIWGGLTFQQIAEALGLSPNTAASRYRYALANLRQALAEEPTYE